MHNNFSNTDEMTSTQNAQRDSFNIKPMDIEIIRATESRIAEVDQTNLQFGKHYSDHMFMVDFENGK